MTNPKAIKISEDVTVSQIYTISKGNNSIKPVLEITNGALDSAEIHIQEIVGGRTLAPAEIDSANPPIMTSGTHETSWWRLGPDAKYRVIVSGTPGTGFAGTVYVTEDEIS